MEAGKLTIDTRPFQLIACVEEVTNIVAERAETKNLALPVSYEGGLPVWVLGDALRLHQILLNLLSNAVKFTSEGKVSLSVSGDGNMTYFQVVDSGIGISDVDISKLFSPFEQADSSTTREYGGSGLGLAISLNLANLMGGDVSVESQLGKGSVFTLNLPFPATKPPPIEEDTGYDQAGPRLTGLRVLAADDVEINRLILEDLLMHEGVQPVFAENGEQALRHVEEAGEHAFDVVLMDVQMPVMDGHIATQRIHEIAPELPVIGLTAHALAEEKKRCLASGMVEHVTKPIDVDVLVKAIQQNVNSSGPMPSR
ncbi:MAG: hypothetical protein DIZ77_00655 [endosymbiont of Seepiophila jonesi]|uniref:histidine kinase n=1 Tax=endosymbiont of Lamellibrachia luymesi TaxID=2200907 RepID=A0A370E1C7_9GAMM|nr:MAG: hypothetical protein DIZ79_04385 [endosymbiont of Lamellibrachia luymesi]RDH94533.1 MAG: hypothetical protein DIZ77_00655 [endosymbiont of Seepiophila jonesi]